MTTVSAMDSLAEAVGASADEAIRIKEIADAGDAGSRKKPFFKTSGDGEIFARVVRAMYTDDETVREAARRVVSAFPPGEQPPDFRVSDLYADLGKGGRFNSWMLADVEKVEGSVAGLRVWQTTIDMLGKAIHMSSGTVCLNGLLGIAEKGFKSPDRSVREETFKAWEVLIDNFALSDSVLLSQKRLRLLTRPLGVRSENQVSDGIRTPPVRMFPSHIFFRVRAELETRQFQANNSVNREPLANAKLKTWWHLINRLEANSVSQMESVVMPFIRFCYGNPPSSASCSSSPGKAATAAKSPDDAAAAAKSPLTPSSPVKKYGSMPPLCLDAVAQLLNCHDKGPNSRDGHAR